MRLDVVVVTYESARHLPACLAALPGQANVVVVDNASADASADLAVAAGARVVRNSANRGFAAAANQGARLGRRELVLFLNPDAVIEQADLARLAATIEEDPSTAAAGPRLLRPDGGEQRAWWPFPSPAATWAEAFGLHRLRPPRPGPGGTVPSVVGACLLVRRSAFAQLGGFDERFWLYGEEADLCRRAWAGGWRVRWIPEAAARHVGGASSGDGSAAGVAFEHFQRGAELFVAKHHGRVGLVAHRTGLLVGCLLRMPLLALRGDAQARGRLATRRAITARLVRRLASDPAGVAR